jgi:hypothetical protein
MSLLSRQTVENWAYNQESLENLQKKKKIGPRSMFRKEQ